MTLAGAPKIKLVLLVTTLIVTLDHITKWLIVQYIPYGGDIVVWPGFFDIVHTRNTGAAFGILSDWDSPLRDVFFYAVGALAFGFLIQYIKSTPITDKITLIGLSLVTGGAIGNISDRIIRGSVVDFLSVHYQHQIKTLTLFGYDMVIPLTWPAFNVADSAICVGVGLLVVQSLRGESQNPQKD